MLAGHDGAALAEEIAALAADQLELDFDARAFRLEALRALDQVGVEGARQALVGGDQNQQNALFVARRASSGFSAACSSSATAAATLPSTLRSSAP